jgi:serine/threonine protein kinase
LVDNKGTIKVSDFGASKLLVEDGKAMTTGFNKSMVGSPYWMAPEVVSRIGHGKPADIWSLGCCVVEMLTSKPPWHEVGTDPIVILDVIKNTDDIPKIPEHVSKECRGFLEYCFCRNPFERAKADELLYHPFVLMKNPQALKESMDAAALI